MWPTDMSYTDPPYILPLYQLTAEKWERPEKSYLLYELSIRQLKVTTQYSIQQTCTTSSNHTYVHSHSTAGSKQLQTHIAIQCIIIYVIYLISLPQSHELPFDERANSVVMQCGTGDNHIVSFGEELVYTCIIPAVTTSIEVQKFLPRKTFKLTRL